MKEPVKKKIIITGGAGGVGAYVALSLARAGHSVRVFDLPTTSNMKVFRAPVPGIETLWGDITNERTVRDAVNGIDEIIHLAAIVVPNTEADPQLAHKVNVEGTKNIIRATEAESERTGTPVALRFSSSVTVYGITANIKPPVPFNHPLTPTDVYTETKILAEKAIRESGLPRWSIYRFAAAQYLTIRPGNFSQMRIIPPDNRIEFVHIFDIADAFLNSIGNSETYGRIFILSGGPKCQMLYRDELLRTFGLLGFPEPKWRKFTTKPFPLDWYDSAESNRVLRYQNRDFDNYLADFRAGLGLKYHAIRYAAAPLMQLLRIHL